MTETATSTTATPVKSNENTMAAVAYILTWITGLIVLLTSPKTAKYQRWHAIQAIGLGIAVAAFYIVWNIIVVGTLIGGGGVGSAAMFSLVSMLVWLGVIVLVILLAV